MAVTAYKHFATLSSATRTGGAVAWTNPGNAGASDDTYATSVITTATETHWLWGENAGFTTSDVPTGSTILGFEISFERKVLNGPTGFSGQATTYYNAVKASALHGTQKTTVNTPTGSDTNEVVGGAADLWGGTFTDADVIATTTGVAIAFGDTLHNGVTISADDIQIRWYYTPPNTRRNGGSFM